MQIFPPPPTDNPLIPSEGEPRVELSSICGSPPLGNRRTCLVLVCQWFPRAPRSFPFNLFTLPFFWSLADKEDCLWIVSLGGIAGICGQKFFRSR